ncbi:MAG: T9SS type A sorting domain-containing protein [Saprospiraceae bacterium]|nr:T9SS type A sorting domain-containing protein [Saprospiraceae bacterium]
MVIPLPTIDLGADIIIQQGQDTVLDATGTGLTYEWSTGATTPTLEVTSMGTYSVTVTNSFGCTATDEVVVSVMTSVEGKENQYKITVSPNPTKDLVYIACEGDPISSIELVDNLGRLILEDATSTPEGAVRTMQLANLSDGAYHLKVTVKDFVEIITVIKH